MTTTDASISAHQAIVTAQMRGYDIRDFSFRVSKAAYEALGGVDLFRGCWVDVDESVPWIDMEART